MEAGELKLWPWELAMNHGHGGWRAQIVVMEVTYFLSYWLKLQVAFFLLFTQKYRISCEHKVFIQFITSDCIMMGDGKCKLVVHSFEELCDLRFSILCPVDLNPDSNLLVF